MSPFRTATAMTPAIRMEGRQIERLGAAGAPKARTRKTARISKTPIRAALNLQKIR